MTLCYSDQMVHLLNNIQVQIAKRSSQQKKVAKDLLKNAIHDLQRTISCEASEYDAQMLENVFQVLSLTPF
jgi:hypothetical protein